MLHYWTFNLLDRVQTTIFKVLEDEGSITAASPSLGNAKVDQINISHARMAKRTLNNGLATLASVLADAETLEVVTLYKNSKFYEATQARHHAASGNGHPSPADHNPNKKTKREQIEKPRKPGPINTSVQFVVMPTTWPSGETPLCAGTLRNLSKGCGNPATCTKSHLHISKWSKKMLDFMKAHVKTNADTLSWNHKFATAKIMGLKYHNEVVNKD